MSWYLLNKISKRISSIVSLIGDIPSKLSSISSAVDELHDNVSEIVYSDGWVSLTAGSDISSATKLKLDLKSHAHTRFLVRNIDSNTTVYIVLSPVDEDDPNFDTLKLTKYSVTQGDLDTDTGTFDTGTFVSACRYAIIYGITSGEPSNFDVTYIFK